MSDSLHDELRRFLAKSKMPSSPTLAVHILELAENPNSTVEQFAELIQMDPALSARLLRMTNSATIAQRAPVTTIQRAVTLLGLNRVRTVSLGFQLVGHANQLGKCPFDMERFWQQSVLRGCLAREFAEAVLPACADEAFLVGLLQDCGILLLVQLLGRPYAELCGQTNLSPTAFYQAEQERFRFDHVQAIGALGREWKLPETVVSHIEAQHTPVQLTDASDESQRLDAISYLVGTVRLTPTAEGDGRDPELTDCARALGLDENTLSRCTSRAAESYAEMCQLLEGIVPDDVDVTDLLSQANEHLTMGVAQEHQRSLEEQARLESALGEYRDLAARDPLTGILNRGALVDALRKAVRQARDRRVSITVLFLDLDNFKRLNDTFGHKAGDEVLKVVARLLTGRVPNAGIAGRYGGEEFVLAAIGLNEREAEAFAECVVTLVRQTEFPGLNLPAPVTCSVGAVWAWSDGDRTAEDLVAAADKLMYQAKRAGKDRSSFAATASRPDADLRPSDPSAVIACTDALIASAFDGTDTSVVPEELQRIARELNRSAPQQILEMRKQTRNELIAPCRVTTLSGTIIETHSQEAYVRNISTGGLGLLSTRALARGQPAEAALLANGKPRLYVAGVVAFCRHVEGAVHEIGMQLFCHARKPILSGDPVTAMRNLNWVADALRAQQPTFAANT